MEQQFLNSIYFKSIMISYDREELVDMLDDNDNPLNTFMILLEDTLELDPSFLSLDDSFPEKVHYVLNHYRFDEVNRNEKTIDKVNNIIVFCNEIISMSEDEKNDIYFNYVRNQTFQRRKFIFYEDDLFEAIGMDAVVYEAVKNNRVDNPYIKKNIVPTTYYLLHNCFPLVLDKDYYNNLKNILVDENILSRKDRKKGKKILKTMKRIDNII